MLDVMHYQKCIDVDRCVSGDWKRWIAQRCMPPWIVGRALRQALQTKFARLGNTLPRWRARRGTSSSLSRVLNWGTAKRQRLAVCPEGGGRAFVELSYVIDTLLRIQLLFAF